MSDETEELIKTPGPFGDNFMLERELGRGGMGGVFLGRDIMLDRPVAVKVMQKEYGEDAEFLAKFKKEAQSAAKLIHPNIAQIYSFGVVDNMPYIAMELVAGGSLLQLMHNAPEGHTDIPRVLKICEQVAQALRCAADQGLVHGDVKPENILLDANGNAKLVDFGLAGMQKDTTEIWGTPYYIAPEKLRKDPIDFRADMYNLGGTLYHALTGVAPFEGEDANAVVRKRFEGMPKRPCEIRSDIPVAVDKLVMKMLAFDREKRYPTFEALLEAFKEVMATGLTAAASKPASPSGAVRKPGARKMTLRTGAKKVAAPKLSTSVSEPAKLADTEEEEGGNPLGKVVLGVVGGLLLIGLIGGGLVWYKIADDRSAAAKDRAAIVRNIADARQAIADTSRIAVKFGHDFEEYAAKATSECEEATRRIAAVVPEVADRLKPAPSEELLKAIALTNTPVVVQATNAVNTGSNAVNAVSNVVNAADGEDVHASDAYRNATPATSSTAESETSTDEPVSESGASDPSNEFEAQIRKLEADKRKCELAYKRDLQQVAENAVNDVNDLWNRAYSCQASVIRIGISVRKIQETAAKADALKDESKETMLELASLSGEVTEYYNAARNSSDVTNVQKESGMIKSKSAKSLKVATDSIFRRRNEHERELKKLDEGIEKIRNEIAVQANRRTKVANESEAAKLKFDALQAGKSFVLLQWDSAIRDLEFLKQGFETTEGKLVADEQIKKVQAMKAVQMILVRNLKDYQFKKGPLGREQARVREADMKEIKLAKPDGKDTKKESNFKINWVTFYKEYHTNLNELFIQFIENGRKNGSPRLTLNEWGIAMAGTALTLKIVCADDAAASSRADQIVKNIAKVFPSYVKTLKMMFPEIEFEEIPEE